MKLGYRVLFLMITATLAPSSPNRPLLSGDWVGQFTTGDSALFVRARFTGGSAAGNRDATASVFDHGNHGLLAARTGYDREVQALSRYVPGFQDGLVRWIVGHVRRG